MGPMTTLLAKIQSEGFRTSLVQNSKALTILHAEYAKDSGEPATARSGEGRGIPAPQRR